MASLGSQYGLYGTLPLQQLEAGLGAKGMLAPKEKFQPRKRAVFTLGGMCVSLFFPWLLFSLLYALVTFNLHYGYAGCCWLIVFLAILVPLAFGALAGAKFREDSASASTFGFLFIVCLVAVIAGPILGDLNYWTNMQPYYDLQTLNKYDHVNPSQNKGQQMMDAGIVQFVEGSALDLKKAQVFQSVNNYCVAPVSVVDPKTGRAKQLQTYDFWAVGLNCCGYNMTQALEYKCGAYASSTARQGLRLMSENQRDYFRLAVQQAAAKHKIKANRPIFLYWTDDAVSEQESYWNYGSFYFWLGVGMFFAVMLLLTLVATLAVSKLGY